MYLFYLILHNIFLKPKKNMLLCFILTIKAAVVVFTIPADKVYTEKSNTKKTQERMQFAESTSENQMKLFLSFLYLSFWLNSITIFHHHHHISIERVNCSLIWCKMLLESCRLNALDDELMTNNLWRHNKIQIQPEKLNYYYNCNTRSKLLKAWLSEQNSQTQ